MYQFLQQHRADKGVFTHTSMAGGSYDIPPDQIETFVSLYATEILKGTDLYLTERHKPIGGPCVMDLDFRYLMPKGKRPVRHIRKKVIKKIVDFIDTILIEFLGLKTNRTCVVLQRPEQYAKKKTADGVIWSDGLHIHKL